MGYIKRKTDKNQADIVASLLEIPGVSVEPNHDDILVGYKNQTFWFELKNPNEMTKDGRVVKRKNCRTQKKQTKLNETWNGFYQIVSSIDEILIAIGINK